MAKAHKLPDIIIDFIRTHHGDSRVEYFYQSYLKNFPEGEDNAALFTYPGPLPYSKETAIVMMADTVEAAARSLKAPTTILIDEMVEKLIAHKIAQQQFINSNITFKEINTIKKVLKKMLHSIYHARVEYPK
jgi:membrane-associated HD superfamily phosphohydrolase